MGDSSSCVSRAVHHCGVLSPRRAVGSRALPGVQSHGIPHHAFSRVASAVLCRRLGIHSPDGVARLHAVNPRPDAAVLLTHALPLDVVRVHDLQGGHNKPTAKTKSWVVRCPPLARRASQRLVSLCRPPLVWHDHISMRLSFAPGVCLRLWHASAGRVLSSSSGLTGSPSLWCWCFLWQVGVGLGSCMPTAHQRCQRRRKWPRKTPSAHSCLSRTLKVSCFIPP